MKTGAKIRIKWDDIQAIRAADEGGSAGVLAGVEAILEASNQIAPMEFGTLIGSGAVDVDRGRQEAHVFYDTKYAAMLHQHPEYTFRNGRRGKYLGTAARQAKAKALSAIGSELTLRFRRR